MAQLGPSLIDLLPFAGRHRQIEADTDHQMTAGPGTAAHLHQNARQLAALIVEIVGPLELDALIAKALQRFNHCHADRQTEPHGRRHALFESPVHAEDQLATERRNPGFATTTAPGCLTLGQTALARAQLIDPIQQVLVGRADDRKTVHRRHRCQFLQGSLII